MQQTTNTCRICNSIGDHPIITCKEMMFGTREEFNYFRCSSCGCLQIQKTPRNLKDYYPDNYMSHTYPDEANKNGTSALRRLRKQRSRTALFGTHKLIDSLLSHFINPPKELYARPNDVSSIVKIIRTAGIKRFDARILDVGCGIYSYWLSALEALGFSDLVGIDPLIHANQKHNTVTILNKALSDITGQYDLITLHHSLEHIPEQSLTMNYIKQRLSPNGVCVVRIPTVSSEVWDKYQTNWVELDAPRHLYLHSIESLKLLARQADLEVFDIQFDSTAFEFYGSELYSRDIPLTDAKSPWINPRSTLFAHEEMEQFRLLARKVNEQNRGGRAAFFLRPAHT